MALRSSGGRDRKLKWPLRSKVLVLVALYSGMVRSAAPVPRGILKRVATPLTGCVVAPNLVSILSNAIGEVGTEDPLIAATGVSCLPPCLFVYSGCLASEWNWPTHSEDHSVSNSSTSGSWQRPWSDRSNDDQKI